MYFGGNAGNTDVELTVVVIVVAAQVVGLLTEGSENADSEDEEAIAAVDEVEVITCGTMESFPLIPSSVFNTKRQNTHTGRATDTTIISVQFSRAIQQY